MNKKIVIIGAGPTGLGAAYRLQELGHKNWKIYEKQGHVGGLAASFVDSQGFTWDVGGHVMFSHYKYFDNLTATLLGSDYFEHMRESWIWTLDKWIPYPFQNNIRYLPKEPLFECILGLIEAQKKTVPSNNFEEWIMATFGKGIAKYFMLPYNFKVWGTPLSTIDKHWISERVSVVDIERVLRNVIFEKDDVSWGPNNTFKFPKYGGTGGLFKRFEPYIKDHLFLKKDVVGIDLDKKTIRFSDGTDEQYDALINTSPLEEFIDKMGTVPETVKEASKGLIYNGGYIVGIGLKRRLTSNKCWMYFPENNSPFYRITYFSNYSSYNVPNGDAENYCSIMCETSYSGHKSVDKERIIEETIQGLINSKIITPEDEARIVSTYLIDISHSYPVPTIGRDNALEVIQPYLESNNIFSRGRFGAWKYEIGNMDHSLMMGVEIINRILLGEKESTWSL